MPVWAKYSLSPSLILFSVDERVGSTRNVAPLPESTYRKSLSEAFS